MFERKQIQLVIVSAVATFFLIATLTYVLFTTLVLDKVEDRIEEPKVIDISKQEVDILQDNEAVMSQDVVKVELDTKVIFEIIDQFDIVTSLNVYQGANWRGLTDVQIQQMYPEYELEEFTKERVFLSRLIERNLESEYMITLQGDDIIIAVERNYQRAFHHSTELTRDDVSDRLKKILDKGIPITIEQKDAIIKDVDELYVILQEHDE